MVGAKPLKQRNKQLMFKRYAKIKFTQNKLSLFQDFQLQTIVHSTLIECAFFYNRIYIFFCSLIRSYFLVLSLVLHVKFFFIAETKNSQNTRYTNRIYIKTITTKKISLTVGTGAANVEPLPNSIDSNPSGTILIHYPCVHEK